MRLYVKRILFGVEAARHVKRQRLIGATTQLSGVLTNRDRVLVHHAVEALVSVAIRREVADRAKIVANGQIAAGLHARVANFLFVDHVGVLSKAKAAVPQRYYV